MRRIWRNLSILIVGGGALLCAQARLCRFDSLTMQLPHPIRSLVATIAVHENGVGPNALDRALMIDPENAAAWGRRCDAYVGSNPQERLADCRKAVSLEDSAANLRAEGAAFEEAGDSCGAASTFRAALGKRDLRMQKTYVMRDEARTALACGDAQGSLVALRTAEEVDKHDQSDGLSVDRGYMSVVYDKLNQPQKAKEMCTEANPGYGSCTCTMGSGGPSCTQDQAPGK